MSMRNKLLSTTLACFIGSVAFSISTPSRAGDAGAFIGGIFATKLIQNSRRSADAEEQQAYAAQQRPVAQTSSASKSPQQRISELDKLAAGGYITPAEYKAKKKTILDSM